MTATLAGRGKLRPWGVEGAGAGRVGGPGVARYGSIWACRSPGCCSIHSRAARQAWKYSSSVDSAAALTDVVTPPGEIPEPSAADGWVSEPVDAGEDTGPPSVPDEQPKRVAKPAVARPAGIRVPAHTDQSMQHWPP